jgi:uncharacterized membrane protein YraQ (UPF0718 family)
VIPINSNVQAFITVFTSILLEAFPFILLGVLLSSIIHVFVSETFFKRIIPKNMFLGTAFGAVMGFFFPVCDCGTIPVARRLMKKGVPLHTGIAFMLAAPIINPVVLFATYYAFKSIIPEMFVYRSLLGLLIAITVGILFGLFVKKESFLLEPSSPNHQQDCRCHHQPNNKMKGIIQHARGEFFDIGKFLIMGAAIAAAVQTFLPKELIHSIGQNTILAIFAMLLFAYLLSLCSTADSFIAKTFIGQFTNSSILAFLLIGPMIDIKNTLVMAGNFKVKYVLNLIGLLFLLCFIAALLAKFILLF